MGFPVVKGVSYGLAHAPSLVRHGSKPVREIAIHGEELVRRLTSHLRTYEDAVAYPPNQVFLGLMRPDRLWTWPSPRYLNPVPDASTAGPYGSIICEREVYARMLVSDQFDLMWFSTEFADELRAFCLVQCGWSESAVARLSGHSLEEVSEQISVQDAVPLYSDGDTLIGCMRRGHEVDEALTGRVLLENLACKATGQQAVEHLFLKHPKLKPDQVDYLIGCGEEAVGDRYQRGGGNMAKAIGEGTGCMRATGSDLKAFCCSPVHALVVGAALVQAGVFRNVVVVGGCSLAKLGMKSHGHLAHNMPIIEDVLASLAIWIAPDDGENPQLRLDCIGKHDIGAGGSAQAIAESTVVAPLEALGLKLTDVDKYAVELHDPEVTEPAGSGNVPNTNYRLLAGLAAMRGEIGRDKMDDFVKRYGMPGYSPTQGHIASAVPFMAHARDMILDGEIQRAMFVAKGSLFLGRLTQLSDGVSIMLERNRAK